MTETTPASPVSLDHLALLIAEEIQLSEAIAAAKKRLKEIQGLIGRTIGGSEIGTIAGRPAYRYVPVNDWRGGDFKKEHPDIYAGYVRAAVKDVFDLNEFKAANPGLYAEYQTWRLTRIA